MKLDNSLTNFIIGSLLFGIFLFPLFLSIVTLTLKKGSILEIIIKKN